MRTRLLGFLLLFIIGAFLMDRNFGTVMPLILKHEGGYVNHPRDPGGHTNKGVTLATLRRYKPGATVADLKGISNDLLHQIYKDGYWDQVKAYALPSGVDYAVFDFAVNSGPGRAAKYLQAAVGVKQDGIIGNDTLAAVAKHDPDKLINSICDARMAFLKKLPTWNTFGKGWASRVAGVRKKALALAAGAQPAPAPPKPVTAPQIPTDPVVVHVEDNPPAVKPGPAQKPVERNPWWIALFAFLGAIFGRKK